MTELFLSEEDLTNEISKYIFTSKYARYIPELKRRETWNESVDRVRNMHLSRFSHLDEKDLEEIRWAFSKVADKEVIPSMRSMQFGGKAQEVAHARGYNCCMLHINSVRSFAEVFYLLLCGCGVGISLTQEFFNRLPDLVGPQDKTGTVLLYTIEDSIEGWSDSVEVLLSCYMRGTPFSGRRIVFDYSKIRPAGAPLKTSGGKAPGYVGLKNAHMKIKALLDHIIEDLELTRMRTIDAYDILCHSSDAVLSGGVRRSAMMVLFDKDDKEMLASKVGDWTDRNPQRARSNNSVIIPPNSMTFEEFSEIFERTRQWGEPGFAFIPQNAVTNPCQPASAPILTKNGLRTMGDIEIGDEIWSETGWTTVVKKWSTGIKPVYKYTTTSGYFLGTENHRVVSNGSKIEAGKASSIDRLAGPTIHIGDLNPDDIMAGLLIGDGSRNHPTGIQTILYIGDNDSDYFDSEISNLIVEPVSYIKKGFKVKSDIEPEELTKIQERAIPERYLYCDSRKARGFLRGLYSANGSVAGNRITLKTTSKVLREQVQLLLSSLGIRSYFTTNKSNDVTFSNGTYSCKESYDINITSDRGLFMEYIGFIQEYKNKKVVETPVRSRKSNFDIVNVEFIRDEEVFDITVDNAPHTYWTGGLNVSNCAEITTIPVTNDGVCGVQMCNLTSINGAKIHNEEDFYEAAKAATIIGTLQASYTDFPYLSKSSEEITREESLLGVSITGVFENEAILLSPLHQEIAAQIAVETNERWAEKLGINPAARITCIKPEGTSSIVYGTMASGIHPAHDRFMIRRVQANKNDNVYKFFKTYNPHMCEESVWSANKTDDVISFPIKVSDDARIKAHLSAKEHLDIIKSTQEHWVKPGGKNNKKPIHHSVSCTVLVKDEEWDDVARYLYDNQDSFTCVSLLPAMGDKKYAQAPMGSVQTDEEFIRFEELAHKMMQLDYTLMVEDDDETNQSAEMACAGGACEIVYS